MEKDLSMQDVIALRDLETEHGDHHALKSIAWVIGVVIVFAIIVFWLRRHHDERCEQGRYENGYRQEHGENRYGLKCLEKQVEKLEEKAYFTHGKVERLYGDFCYAKHEIEEIERRCYPQGYIGEDLCGGGRGREGRGGCGEHRHGGNCGRKFITNTPYTAGTPTANVIEDCVCNG